MISTTIQPNFESISEDLRTTCQTLFWQFGESQGISQPDLEARYPDFNRFLFLAVDFGLLPHSPNWETLVKEVFCTAWDNGAARYNSNLKNMESKR